ncbi:DUF1896 family protein [Pedobacter sp. UBA4863]|uniref:DUF1896 family protein n=1 Tax=Pedobacter sp. UBA4863 TaxID=1947060 RepID=UPI0025F148ED|nr:DUF1896 family protein [Pedobacter sp. UBA4863]
MQQLLIEKLGSYISINNPDLLASLQESYSLRQYLEDKVEGIAPYMGSLLSEQHARHTIIELCMARLTEELKPSKYNYLYVIMAEEFEEAFARFSRMGVLTYELLNMLEPCLPVFEKHGFSTANQESRELRYEITGTMVIYLEEQ